MRIKVLKFGGTSVRTHEARMAAALRVISAKEQGFTPVVVVSAIGRRGEPYATDTLVQLLRDIDSSVEPDERELDLVMACGEILSSVVFAHSLKTLGHRAMAMRGGQAGIRTDGRYGAARILGVNPIGLFEVIRRGAIPVVCGFQGVWVQGGLPGAELTTLGRGGSDTSAAAVGAAIGAEAVEIYTDVDGVKSADPDFVPEAPTLEKVTYDEVAEIAHLGAKVLHPRAAEIGMKFSIPIWVKNTFSQARGTEVVPRESLPGRHVTGVTHSGKMVYFQISLKPVATQHRVELASHIYQVLAKHGIGLAMVNNTSESIGFAIDREDFSTLLGLLDGLVVPFGGDQQSIYLMQVGDELSPETETQMTLLSPLGQPKLLHIEINEGCTMVSVVGQDVMQQPGLYAKVLRTMHEAKVPVIQVSDSDYSVSCLIPESELRKAVQILHDIFVLI